MQDRGLAAYIAELVGTMLLIFAICTVVVTLYVATSATAQTGSDFAVVGLVHAIVLFGLIITLGAVSGGHFNPAVTLGAGRACGASTRSTPSSTSSPSFPAASSAHCSSRRCLLDEGRAGHYGAASISPLLAGDFAGAVRRGHRHLPAGAGGLRGGVQSPGPPRVGPARDRAARWGSTSMIFGPLTGGPPFNLARWFGPALIGNEFANIWAYIVGPIVGALARRGPLPLRDRWVAVRARSGASDRGRRGGRERGCRRRDGGPAAPQVAEARAAVACGVVRRVTFSRNYTLSLSRTCRCYCKYCAFATHRAHLYAPDEVERRLDEAVRRNAKELLVLTGERPEVNPEVAERLRVLGPRRLRLLRRLGL